MTVSCVVVPLALLVQTEWMLPVDEASGCRGAHPERRRLGWTLATHELNLRENCAMGAAFRSVPLKPPLSRIFDDKRSSPKFPAHFLTTAQF